VQCQQDSACTCRFAVQWTRSLDHLYRVSRIANFDCSSTHMFGQLLLPGVWTSARAFLRCARRLYGPKEGDENIPCRLCFCVGDPPSSPSLPAHEFQKRLASLTVGCDGSHAVRTATLEVANVENANVEPYVRAERKGKQGGLARRSALTTVHRLMMDPYGWANRFAIFECVADEAARTTEGVDAAAAHCR
jgi:hypothetical protein